MTHKPLFYAFMALLLVVAGGCVEQSDKYKRLQAQLDSAQVAAAVQNAEFEEIFATLNDIEQGLKSIREAENFLQIQSVKGGEISISAREQMKNNIQYIAATLEDYKAQIARLEADKKYQSAQFQKRLKSIMAELEGKERLIEDLSHQLTEKERQLTVKAEQIVSMDQSIAALRTDLAQLEQKNAQQVVKMSEQERQIYSGYYIIGNKSALISAKVLTKGGLFRAAKVSYQAEQSVFQQVDIRNTHIIPLYAKKGKVLSIHPAGTYTLSPDENGILILHISRPDLFWEQTKYLVVKVD